jgi:outer membrane protein assembly factor BamA
VRWPLALAALFGAGRAALAQAPEVQPPIITWLDVAYPKLFYTLRDGLTAGGYFAFISPFGFADYDRPPAYRASFALDGQISTSGSRELELEARLPGWFDGWRLTGTLAAQQRVRENYYGIGNSTQIENGQVNPQQPYYYRSRNLRLLARGEVQRRVAGPLRVLAGIHAERWRIDTLPGPSRLARDLSLGADPTIGRATREVALRAGLVLDSRDNEVAPHRGVLVEVLYADARGGWGSEVDYTRTTVSAAGYVPIGPQVVVAARVVGEGLGGTPRLGSFYRVEASDRFYEGVGGPASHRGLEEHRLLGRNKLFGNLDLRYDAYAIPTLARVTLVGFLDAGRVFEPEPFRLTTTGLKVGAGGGLFAQIGRAGILGTTLGLGPDGLSWQVHTRWTY